MSEVIDEPKSGSMEGCARQDSRSEVAGAAVAACGASSVKLDVEEMEDTDEIDMEIAIACFELGLKHSSPKVLLGLMPDSATAGLTSEHLKSHLQKYRLNSGRSKDEFKTLFRNQIREAFAGWIDGQGGGHGLGATAIPHTSSFSSSASSASLGAGSSEAMSETDAVAAAAAAQVLSVALSSETSSTSLNTLSAAALVLDQVSDPSQQANKRARGILDSTKDLLVGWQELYKDASGVGEKMNSLAFILPSIPPPPAPVPSSSASSSSNTNHLNP